LENYYYFRKAALLPEESTQIGASIKVRVKHINSVNGQMILDIPDEEGGMAIGMEKRGKENERSEKEIILVTKHAKPFQIYSSKLIGPWPYGGTSAQTSAELLLPGGSTG